MTLQEIVEQACDEEEEYLEEVPLDAAGRDHAQGQLIPEAPKEETPFEGASAGGGCPDQH